MARRAKHATTPTEGREFKLRLPEDIAQRIEAKAKAEGRPINRTIINELDEFPRLEAFRDLHELNNVLARYGARIAWLDLSEELLRAVEAVLAAEGSAQQAAIDKLRVERNAMLKTKAANP
jgi:hypothetical protein